jgi:hypothetical protein
LRDVERLQVVLEQRFRECHLELHPENYLLQGQRTLG